MTKIRDIVVADLASSDLSKLDASLLRESMKSQWTLTVPRNASAATVVAQARKVGANVVLVVKEDGDPEGVLVPELLANILAPRVDTDGIEDEEFEASVFESFRLSRPPLFWCDKHKHYTTKLPCPV